MILVRCLGPARHRGSEDATSRIEPMKRAARIKRDQKIYQLNHGVPRLSYSELARLYGLSARQVGTIVRRMRFQAESSPG